MQIADDWASTCKNMKVVEVRGRGAEVGRPGVNV